VPARCSAPVHAARTKRARVHSSPATDREQSTSRTTAAEAMLAAIARKRAFAISLTNNHDLADDLVQEALTKARGSLDRFEPGSNMTAWLFTILRNGYYSNYRKRRREVEDPDEKHAARLATAPEQEPKLDFQDTRTALAKLPPDQREALLLIAAEGLSYDQVAAICGVAVGTIKSRVHRGRARLAEILELDGLDDIRADRKMQAAVQRA